MKCSRGRGQRGFTVHEMLLVVAILIVLLAVSIVGLVSYSRRLQLAELDNSAREIFLAAQNRAILLSGGQRLEGLVVKPDKSNRIDHVEVLPGATETTQISVYYIHCSDEKIKELLPTESIDPALWGGDFYIIYEPESGSIVDVFYAEELLVEAEESFPSFYTEWRGAPKEQRMDNDPMIGYYGGEAAESGTAISLRTPVINIENGDSLTVQVTYWLPRSLGMTSEASNVTLTVDLTYETENVRLNLDDGNCDPDDTIAYMSYTYTWTLDTLDGVQFQDLFETGGCGDDFTITADVSYEGSLEVNGARKTATDNSLFDTGSGGDTAYIACLRHLQNLDKAHSLVAGKTKAVQRNDIQQVGEDTLDPAEADEYIFDPIENGDLQSYDGQEHTIENIKINRTDGAAGLFGSLDNSDLSGIRLVNTTVTGSTEPVGVLVGNGSNLTLDNCQVYWENQSDEHTNLRYLLGDSADPDGFNYQVTGNSIAGGLAGSLTDSTLTRCSAATLVSGITVGGLVGQGSGLSITSSYAASYLQGRHTAGLVGNLTAEAAATEITRSYAVGFLDTANDGTAAGLCLGSGSATVSRSYSAMLFTAGRNNYPLCASGTYDTYTHYLESELFGFEPANNDHAASYDSLVDPSQWNDLFGDSTFTTKTTAESHPYNLQTTLSLTNYTYPGLAELDHWGDWGAQFQNGSLVYYEKYSDDDYGFSGGGISHLQDKPVVEDGYAVAYWGTAEGSAITINLSIGYQVSDTAESTESMSYNGSDMYVIEDVANAAGQKEDYYLLPLPEKIVNSDYASVNFYQKITVTNTVSTDNTPKSYYYNPHFADAILPYDANTDLSQLAAQLRVSVRSPRHLYNLSRFYVYYSSAHQYRFLQQLDLDYTKYDGYNLFAEDWAQSPIGLSAAQPFRGTYYGNCHTISGVVLQDEDENENGYPYVGLFGYTTGVIQDVVYHMTTPMTFSRTGSSVTVYAGGLIGYNGGTVDNCAVDDVDLGVHCYDYSTAYLGGLAGINAGVIRNSAAEVADLSSNNSFSSAYTGGFVGRNAAGASIDRCYAVGSVSASRARYGIVYACGFAGRNSATVSRSYAAVRLTVSGDAVGFGFCPDSTTNCVYLNDGNFTYRDAHYGAQYTDDYAKAVTWNQLTGGEQAAALGMSKVAGDYPYPTAVMDGQSQPVHYGQWPDAMELGTMGVYYWEKLEIGDEVSYHISAISQLDDGETMESSTLSTAHGDGGVVTEYGYGYFYAGENAPELTSNGIGYGNYTDFTFDETLENTDVNKALSDLMGGRYTFHSFNTWGTQEDKEGLYQEREGDEKNPPNGTWTLKQGDATLLTVRLNPFFANAMSSSDQQLPGTEDNPYEVRSIDQLQFINWNSTEMNTKTVMSTKPTKNFTNFPYLSYGENGWLTYRSFYWEQTHDMEGEENVAYTPIAEVYDSEAGAQQSYGTLFGWFSGTYDGNDYMIADVNIQGQTSSCAGLFGVVFNGTLQNIVLHSTDGTAYVRSNTSNGKSCWYAIGGLAGVAGSETSSAVVNCTISGYTIEDVHTGGGGWGGTGLGGLIGISNMDLKKCTAETDIILNSDDNDNIRVGGLVGSCQGSINSCYAGGSITVDPGATAGNDRGMYIGGIVGGIYMKPLYVGGNSNIKVGKVGDDLQNWLNNCYSYVQLPYAHGNDDIKGLYAVGGSGELDKNNGLQDHGYTTYENNYYLSSVVLQNNKNGITLGRTDIGDWNKDVTALTYSQMANTTTADGLLQRLNNGIILDNEKFHTVTTKTTNNEPLSGRYSFGNDDSLLGTDYPFPTILTQSSDVAPNGTANVHYGDWPIEGILREDGALPVNLDLFANYKQEETLELSGVSTNGTWAARVKDQYDTNVATATVQQNNDGKTATLTITGQSAGSTVVTVTYTVGGKTYSLDIEVNVTANLRLTTADNTAVTVFTDAAVSTPLQLTDQDSDTLPDTLLDEITLTHLSVEYDPDFFTTAKITEEPNNGADLRLTATGNRANADKKNLGSTQMTAVYTFKYLGTEYTATAVLSLDLVEPVIAVKPVTFVFEDGEEEQTQRYTGEDKGQFVLKLTENVEAQTLENLRLTAFEPVAVEYKDVAWVRWDENEDGTEKVGTLLIDAYSQLNYPAYAVVRVQYQFQYDGSTHTLWADLPIEVKGPEPEEPTTPTEPPTEPTTPPEEPEEGEVQP